MYFTTHDTLIRTNNRNEKYNFDKGQLVIHYSTHVELIGIFPMSSFSYIDFSIDMPSEIIIGSSLIPFALSSSDSHSPPFPFRAHNYLRF
jgi:hypothetical protein